MKEIEGLSVEEERAAAVFRALGNPARVRIVRELATRAACATSDFVNLLPLAQSTVSQHLKVLKEAGIIQGTVEGGDPCYCLDPVTVRWLAGFTFDICCPNGEECGPDCCGNPGPSRVEFDDLVVPAAAPPA
jgi:ArsR family transcriptional regulator